MAIVYRTDGAWGAGKGANLTAAEVDGNFADLDGRVSSLETYPPTPVEISNVELSGSQLTFHLSNGSSFGPFTLPRATPPVVETQSGSTYTPDLADANTYQRLTAAGGCTITIPPNASVAFPVGTEIHFRQVGGALSIVGGSGVTLNVPTGYDAGTEIVHATVTAKKVAADEWDLLGLLATASA